MARTAEMKLLELMVLKNDISAVIEYIGKKESFQFQTKLKENSSGDTATEESLNIDSQFYESLSKAYTELGYEGVLTQIKDHQTDPADHDQAQYDI